MVIQVASRRDWLGGFIVVIAVVLFSGVGRGGEKPTPTVFRDGLPEKVAETLRRAIESFPDQRLQGGGKPAEAQQRNVAALEQLRKQPWPELDRLQLVRLVPIDQPGVTATAWQLPAEGDELVLLRPNFTEVRVPAKLYAKVERIEYARELTRLIDYLKQRKPDDRRPWDFTFIDDFGADGLPHRGGVYLVHQAYVAAYFGHTAEAEQLVHFALQQRQHGFEQTYHELAWQSFLGGIELLERGDPREKVLAHWTTTLRRFDASPYTVPLKDLTEQLAIQVREDVRLAAEPAVKPDDLPVDKQVDYYMARLPDVRGQQWSQPGHCQTLGFGERTVASDALVKIGVPAVPALIGRLEDRRVTRSIGFWRNFSPSREVLRVQDVAVECIAAIVAVRFYEPSSTSSYLSNEKPEVRERVINDIQTWWKQHGRQTPLEWQLSRLEQGRLHARLETLSKIEKLDKTAVDAVAVLKRWATAADYRDVPRLAEALARRGDLSLLPTVRQTVRDPARDVPSEAVWYLIRHGDIDDFRFLREAARKEINSGADLGTTKIWGAVYSGVESSDRPLAVPLLVDLLDRREITGSRYVANAEPGSDGFCVADSCLGKLIELTGHNEGYRPGARVDQRFAAIDRWLAWWNKEGRAAYLKQHPEIEPLLADPWSTAESLDANTLPEIVEVSEAGGVMPIHYRIPRPSFLALVHKQAILVNRLYAVGPQYRFARPEAGVEWFDSASVTTGDMSLVPAMVVQVHGCTSPDSKGRMWCRWHREGQPPAVFDGKSWTVHTAAASRPNTDDSGEFISAFPGADGAMVFEDTRQRFHLFDADGWVSCETAERLALDHGARLRQALSWPPRPGNNFYHHLIKDAADRVWWSNWERPWGVVDGSTAIRADDVTAPIQGVLSVLYPIGAGRTMLVADENCRAHVVDVRDGRIVPVGPSPVIVGGSPPGGWRTNIVRDSQKQTWVMTEKKAANVDFAGHGGRSQVLDTDGKLIAIHNGWLVLEDHRGGFWFKLVNSTANESAVERLDKDGRKAHLEIPNLHRNAAFAEAPDGTVWTLVLSNQTTKLIRLKFDEGAISIVESYPVGKSDTNGVWCDARGRVWMTQQPSSGQAPMELVRLATVPQHAPRAP